jgi:hypothetical protein
MNDCCLAVMKMQNLRHPAAFFSVIEEDISKLNNLLFLLFFALPFLYHLMILFLIKGMWPYAPFRPVTTPGGYLDCRRASLSRLVVQTPDQPHAPVRGFLLTSIFRDSLPFSVGAILRPSLDKPGEAEKESVELRIVAGYSTRSKTGHTDRIRFSLMRI